jgi:hypothetical protein
MQFWDKLANNIGKSHATLHLKKSNVKKRSIAVCCGILRYVTVNCGVLRYIAVCCGILRCVGGCCGVRCVAIYCGAGYIAVWGVLRYVAVYCGILRCELYCGINVNNLPV